MTYAYPKVPDVGMRNRYASEERELYMAEPLIDEMPGVKPTAHREEDDE